MTETAETESEPGLLPPHMATDLVGHAAAEHVLLDAWSSGRMPHAWLFAGPPGIGKATLAFRLARFVLSQGADQQEADSAGLFGDALPSATTTPVSLAVDPEAPAARLIASEAHPDLKVLRRRANARGVVSSVVRVEDVRTFGGALHLTPADGGWRVAIVDEGERMNRSAENALLKILEEPPPKTLIIIIANGANALLPTTRSRCRKLLLTPLDDDQVAALLTQAVPDLAGGDVDVVVRLSEGSIGRAIDLAAVGGADLYRAALGLLAPLPTVDGERLHALAATWGGRRPKEGEVDAFQTGADLVLRWIDRAIRAAHGAPGLREVISGDLDLARGFVARVGVDSAFRRRDAVRRLFRLEQALNLDRKQVLIDAVHTLAYGEGMESGRA